MSYKNSTGSVHKTRIQKSGHARVKNGQPKGGTVKSQPSGKKAQKVKVRGGMAPKRGVKGRR